MQFFEWRWDEDTVIEYRRSGECNGCAACCKVSIEWQVPKNPTSRPEYLLGLHGWNNRNGALVPARIGIDTEVVINGRHRYFANIMIGTEPEICMYLGKDNRCRIHEGKALIASAWPMSPAHVAALPECSYTFEEIGRWKISELKKGRHTDDHHRS